MIDIQKVRDQASELSVALKRRGLDVEFNKVLELDHQRREGIQNVEKMRQDIKAANKEIPQKKKAGENVDDLLAQLKAKSASISEGEKQIKDIDSDIRDFLLSLPNPPDSQCPDGEDESQNVELRKWGEVPQMDFEPKSHDELGADLGVLDGELGAKLAKTRFTVLKREAARLERALVSFMLDQHREKGYEEVLPPFIANSKPLTGTGQLPKFAEDLFKIEGEDLYLIPTAEVPLTNLVADQVLKDLEPGHVIKYTAYTPCFRSEAGSYGKDTRGYIRQHQFNKVELVKICHPSDTEKEHDALTTDAEAILQALGLHYRVVDLCTGDMGFSASRTYDLEVWLPSQKTYREISSCSSFSDFQARRAGIRYKDKETGKNTIAHTINGSGLAVGRTLVAIFENYQQADGSILIPPVLQPYMGGCEKISK